MDRLALQQEPCPGQPILELFGKERVILEHYGRILYYSEEKICVQSKLGPVCIEGKDLMLRKICDKILVITGHIGNICLEGGA